MATPAVDNEFMQYWPRLTMIEKESLLNVAKQYVLLKKDIEDSEGLRKQQVMEERTQYLKGEGKSFTWDKVKALAISKERKNG